MAWKRESSLLLTLFTQQQSPSLVTLMNPWNARNLFNVSYLNLLLCSMYLNLMHVTNLNIRISLFNRNTKNMWFSRGLKVKVVTPILWPDLDTDRATSRAETRFFQRLHFEARILSRILGTCNLGRAYLKNKILSLLDNFENFIFVLGLDWPQLSQLCCPDNQI